MSDDDRSPPPPQAATKPPARSSGGPLWIGAGVSVLVGVGGFFVLYLMQPTTPPGGAGYVGSARMNDAGLLFAVTLLPLLFVVGLVMVVFARVRRAGWGVLIGAAVSMLVTAGSAVLSTDRRGCP